MKYKPSTFSLSVLKQMAESSSRTHGQETQDFYHDLWNQPSER
jgi:hypothetical protein